MSKTGHDATPARWPVVLSLIALAMTFAFNIEAVAQNKQGNAVGASSGVVGGGASGASNRGGAGGISNPAPGGGPATAGDPALSTGPRGTESTRPGYLGGRNADTVVPPPNTTVINFSETRAGKCPTPGGTFSPQGRISGNNGERIAAIAQYLSRGPQKRGGSNDALLLANVQEELQKEKPDLTLAGTYLGIVAKTAITPSLASDISESLCSPISRDAAEAIAKVAEAQRRKLAQER